MNHNTDYFPNANSGELPVSDNPLAGPDELRKCTNQDFDYLETLYLHLHQHPELSFQEKETSARMATELRSVGFEVTENVGGYGLVGVLKNGEGPTLLIRTDMDALPVKEETHKPYASTVTAKNEEGQIVPVMHACGHDMHMTVWTGTARLLVKLKNQWQGTLICVAQGAEEYGAGAQAMLRDGLYRRFPVPDCALALHVNSELPVGTIGYTPRHTFAAVELMEITVHGKGGHGAYPHTTKNSILLATRIVEALQSLTSTELSPMEPAVIAVGTIHGGTKANVIPDEVKIGLAIRFYSDEVHIAIRRRIQQICHGLARAAGLTEEQYPIISINNPYAPATYNDPTLTKTIVASFTQTFGKDNVRKIQPTMTGEDFGQFGYTQEKVPLFLYWLGAVAQEQYEAACKDKYSLPSLHNCRFIPDYPDTLKTGVVAMTTAALKIFREGSRAQP
ncbi:MAG: amidohydrolase [Cyclobacteriaceae bacterium]